MNRYIQVVLILILACLLYSCSFRKLVKGKKPGVYVWHVVHDSVDSNGVGRMHNRVPLPQPYIAIENNDSSIAIKQLIDQLTPVWKSRLQYRTFKAKARMHMEGPEDKQEFTAHIRIRKDSVIWINITALGGFSFARILINTDSFFMINNSQNTAVCIPLSKAAKILPAKVDFVSIQNLILGEPLRDGVLTDATAFGASWSLKVEDSGYVQLVTYSKNDSTMQSEQLRTHNPSGPVAHTEYSHYEWTDKRRFSTVRTLTIQNGQDIYSLDMNFVKTDFDEQLEYPFSIPAGYEIKTVGQ